MVKFFTEWEIQIALKMFSYMIFARCERITIDHEKALYKYNNQY